WVWETDEEVFEANDRCNQENLLAQLHGGVRALHGPLKMLESNWAYMVMTAVAWNLKAGWALALLEEPGAWQDRHRVEQGGGLGAGSGVQDVRQRLRASALPDRADGPSLVVSVVVVEPAAADLLPGSVGAALLRRIATKSESGCSDIGERQTRSRRKKSDPSDSHKQA